MPLLLQQVLAVAVAILKLLFIAVNKLLLPNQKRPQSGLLANQL